MTKLSFELAGLTFLEPMAFILNWVLMIQAWIYFIRLKKWRVSDFAIGWRWFFLLFGFSGLLGGLSHLLFNYTGLPGKGPGWLAAILSVSAMEFAMIATAGDQNKKKWQYFVAIKMIVAVITLFYVYSFNVVILHCVGMVVFLLVPSLVLMRKGRQELNFFFIGALCLLSALPFKLMAIDFHIWFNRDDISHVFFGLASYCFFRGVKVYEEKTSPQFFLAAS